VVGKTGYSPRQEIELVNQKIDKARKKMSRYFAQNQSLSNLALQSAQGGLKTQAPKEAKNMSVDMVRVGSPFFGAHLTSQSHASPTKTINNKISDTSLKFSPIKQAEFFNPEFASKLEESRTDGQADKFGSKDEDTFSFNNEEEKQHDLSFNQKSDSKLS